MHPLDTPDVYADPIVRLVYGFPPLPTRLHRLRSHEGAVRLIAMTDAQCNAWLQEHPTTECLPWDHP